MSSPAPAPITDIQGESQLDIVRRMFRRKKTAVWGLRVTVALILLALYAPVIASAVPFVWREPGGSLQFPWFARLFDVRTWPHTLDRLFNLALVLSTFYFVARFGLVLTIKDAARRLEIGGKVRKAALTLGVVLAIVQSLGWAFTASLPVVDYAALEAEYKAAGQDYTAIRPIVPYGYDTQVAGLDDKFRSFSWLPGEDHDHLFGTDETGRDVFARILYGTRISLTIGLVAVGIYVTIGVIFGALAGYFRGTVDSIIMRCVEIMICIPSLFLILTIVALFENKSIFLIMMAIGLVSWTGITRLVRGEFLRERNKEYVQAAQAMGLGTPRIVFRHVLPNAVGPVLVSASFGIPGAILVESGLSFLGLGDVTVPSWGRILNDGRINEYWHLILPPSIAIFLTVTAMNLVGDGLRDALDPKLRN